MKLVGVGFGRTGTMSLKGALEELGVPTFHMIDLITGEKRDRDLPYWIKIANNEPVDWDEVFEPWEATVDWPAASRWREMVDHFSDLPVLLNLRDFEGWYKSCANTILAVKEAARKVKIEHLLDRKPGQLSGGQQQRCALARAIVRKARLFLLDEPLSNLDAKLRDRMRSELKRLQRDLNLTTVYVTHDQSEALALSHEIAVMNAGRVVQVGTPRQIYEQPTDKFVADFVGSTNFIGGTVETITDGTCVVRSAMGELKAHASEGVSRNMAVIVSVRPEDVELSEGPPPTADGENVYKGTVSAKDFLGDYLDFHVRVGDVVLQAKAHPSLRTPTGDSIYLRMKAHKCVAIPGVRNQ